MHISVYCAVHRCLNTYETHSLEAREHVSWVQQAPVSACPLQCWQHDLIPQCRVNPHQVLDVAEELGWLHFPQKPEFLQVQQATQEQLHHRAQIQLSAQSCTRGTTSTLNYNLKGNNGLIGIHMRLAM